MQMVVLLSQLHCVRIWEARKKLGSLLVRAYRGEKVERTPIWLMRQAGRYLPEYQKIRAKHRMLDVIRTPELACEVTLQPLKRFELDGAIIFADILTPLIGMGVNLDFVDGEGPRIFEPLKSLKQVQNLIVPPAEENFGYTLQAIRHCVQALHGTPLIGFSGAPFTLSAYLVEGGGSKNLSAVKSFMREMPEAWELLQVKLREMIGSYLCAQAQSGAAALQIFDSWAGELSPADYRAYCLPHLEWIVNFVKKHTNVPLVYFSTGSSGLLELVATLKVDVVSVDWRISLRQASDLLRNRSVLQGNLDPTLLNGDPQIMEQEARRILNESMELPGYVFNLGHGILPQARIENVSWLVRLVREFKRG